MNCVMIWLQKPSQDKSVDTFVFLEKAVLIKVFSVLQENSINIDNNNNKLKTSNFRTIIRLQWKGV